MRNLNPIFFSSFLAVLSACSPSTSTSTNLISSKNVQGVTVDEKLADSISLDTVFVGSHGKRVALGDIIQGDKPAVLMMGYYECPKLCSLTLNGFFGTARNLNWSAGDEYEFIMVSVDPKEGHVLAENKKEGYARYYGRTGAEKGIHFLTGSEENIKKLANEIGFRYNYDSKSKQYIHPAVLAVLSPKGKITRYLYDINFPAKDLKLALIEGAEGKVGTIADRILLFCYQFDPEAGSYSVTVVSMMKVAGVLTILMVILLIFFLRRQTRSQDSRRFQEKETK